MKGRDNGQNSLITDSHFAGRNMNLTWFGPDPGPTRFHHNYITVGSDRDYGGGFRKHEDLVMEWLYSKPRWILLVLRERLPAISSQDRPDLRRDRHTPNPVTKTRNTLSSRLSNAAAATVGIVSPDRDPFNNLNNFLVRK